MFLSTRSSSAATARFALAVRARHCSSLANTGHRNKADAVADENIFSSAKDAMYASKIAHTLREKIFKPDFQSTKSDLSEKERELLHMWRVMGNNPELLKERETAAKAPGGGGRPLSETGAMEAQTTAWEGSGAVAAAREAMCSSSSSSSSFSSTTPSDTQKKSSFEDEAPVNVAEAYGQTFKDSRPLDPSEPVEAKRRRLIYQSRYRGMVEMDLILGHFARCRLESLDTALLDEYDMLLKQLDNDLFRWLIMDLERPAEIDAMRCYHELRKFVEEERTELLGSL